MLACCCCCCADVVDADVDVVAIVDDDAAVDGAAGVVCVFGCWWLCWCW